MQGEEIAEFRAVIPDIQSAIKIGSDGARVQLDVAETDIAEVVRLIGYGRRRVLKVTLEVDKQDA